MTDEMKEINEIMQFYGFQPIQKGTKHWEAHLLKFIKYLHAYGKDMVATESLR